MKKNNIGQSGKSKLIKVNDKIKNEWNKTQEIVDSAIELKQVSNERLKKLYLIKKAINPYHHDISDLVKTLDVLKIEIDNIVAKFDLIKAQLNCDLNNIQMDIYKEESTIKVAENILLDLEKENIKANHIGYKDVLNHDEGVNFDVL